MSTIIFRFIYFHCCVCVFNVGHLFYVTSSFLSDFVYIDFFHFISTSFKVTHCAPLLLLVSLKTGNENSLIKLKSLSLVHIK